MDDQPTVVHVTGEEGWAAIQASGELRRMERMHVHFATRPHMVRRNKWAKVWLRLDLQGAIEAGHDFFLSTNQVLLTKGPIPILYVQQIDEKDDLPVEWRIERIEEEGGMLQRK